MFKLKNDVTVNIFFTDVSETTQRNWCYIFLQKIFQFCNSHFWWGKKTTFITMHNKVENLDSCENLNVSDPFCNKYYAHVLRQLNYYVSH